jgi:hypothetical protein
MFYQKTIPLLNDELLQRDLNGVFSKVKNNAEKATSEKAVSEKEEKAAGKKRRTKKAPKAKIAKVDGETGEVPTWCMKQNMQHHVSSLQKCRDMVDIGRGG